MDTFKHIYHRKIAKEDSEKPKLIWEPISISNYS